jgi:hypothetical protein
MKARVAFTVLVLAAVTLFASPARADVVTAWNSAALNAIRTERTSPPRASRALAILHLSIFDAVNGIARTHEHYLVPSAVPSSASREAAASAAAHRVLATLFPASTEAFDQLHAVILAAMTDSPQNREGVAWGQIVADRFLAVRANDLSDIPIDAPAGQGPGVWVPTPPAFASYLLPQWGQVMPFAIVTPFQFRPAGPPALNSTTYADHYNEVKTVGGSSSGVRTPEQEEIALFWADGAGTETPAGHWNRIGAVIAAAHGNAIEENARLFALLNAAMADAAICAWDAKYAFNFWRPITAIHNGASDGNDATAADETWTPLIVTPPFPDYVSGHSTFSAAAARVLARFFGTDDIAFTTGSDFVPGVFRSFASFSEAAAEAAISRVYGGIHYRFASDDGMTAGFDVGEWVFTHILLPTGNRSRS